MNIWNAIVIKVSQTVAAILLIVGFAKPVAPPQTTIVDIPSTGPATTQVVNGLQPAVEAIKITVKAPQPPPEPPKQEIAGGTPANQPEAPQTPIPEEVATPPPITQNDPIEFQAPAPVAQPETPSPQPPLQMIIIQPPAETQPTITQPVQEQQPMSNAKIEIVNPYPDKGIGRDFLARQDVKDEQNYISIGAILYNDDGTVNQDTQMFVTATDETQDKTQDGTGTLWNNHYVDGQKVPVFYYPFTYQFKTVGDHTITFTAAGLTASVTINVPAEDTRPMTE